MNDLIEGDGNFSEQALATAQWAKPADIANLAHKPGALWMGRAADANETAIGFKDDRHALIVAGNRSGKGTSSIVPNLCLWPGSIVVIDPKGENATVTAARRAGGWEHCDGLDQQTYVLDPFKAAQIPDDLRARFNPLDALDPDDEESVDEAGRIADALVVSQNATDPFWDEQTRTLLKGLILHVITDDDFEGRRNLVTIRRLITSGDVETRKLLEQAGDENIPSAFELLFEGMRRNTAFHGIVSGAGETFYNMALTSQKTLSGVLSAAGNHTEFIDSLPMQRLLAESTPGFSIARLKTDPMGVSVFLSLPQRFMNTHFRWLRMMVALIITEMEKVPGQPKSGHPVLLLLDEFAGLKKMDIIENAAAQIAGFGVKMCFILQTLTQLKTVYKDNWEVFVGNAGTKLFFGIEDKFTREYISKYLGETEVTRRTRTASDTRGSSQSETQGTSQSSNSSTSFTKGDSSGSTTSIGSWGSWNSGSFWNTARSQGTSFSSNQSITQGDSESRTEGMSEGIHKRALLTPDEVGLLFSRVEEKDNAAYPGLGLALASGKRPVIVRRTNYFEDYDFVRRFSPHPDHEFVPLVPKLTQNHIDESTTIQTKTSQQNDHPSKPLRTDLFRGIFSDRKIAGLLFVPVYFFGQIPGMLIAIQAAKITDGRAEDYMVLAVVTAFLSCLFFWLFVRHKNRIFLDKIANISRYKKDDSQIAAWIDIHGVWRILFSNFHDKTMTHNRNIVRMTKATEENLVNLLEKGKFDDALASYTRIQKCGVAQARLEISQKYGYKI